MEQLKGASYEIGDLPAYQHGNRRDHAYWPDGVLRFLGSLAMALERFNWRCDKCDDILSGYSEAGLETIKRLHIEAHNRQEALEHRVDADLFCVTPDDCKMLLDLKVDPLAKDTRSPEELAERYKSKQ